MTDINPEIQRIIDEAKNKPIENRPIEPVILTDEEKKNNEEKENRNKLMVGEPVSNASGLSDEDKQRTGAEVLSDTSGGVGVGRLPETRKDFLKEEKEKENDDVAPSTEGKTTVHHVHGHRIAITNDQKSAVDKKTEEVMKILGNRQVSDIPLTDHYWIALQELDALVANLRG